MIKIIDPQGATPLNDYSGLIPRWVQSRNDLNGVEAENISHAQKKYLKNQIESPALWFNISELKKIHHAMFCDVWKWAGEFRKSVTSIGIKPCFIHDKLGELCLKVNAWTKEPVELTFLEQAALIHHQLVLIHPFENGNGRFSRLIADRYLVAYGCPYPNWPYNLQNNGQLRIAYIESLKAADKGDNGPLISLMRTLGAQDPSLSEFLGFSFYKNRLSSQQRLAMVKALLRSGCEINETKNNGNHPLQISIKMNYQKEAFLLIKHGANVKFRDRSGYDSFEMAINSGMFKIAKAIYDAGYPYVPRMPPSLKIKYEMLYKFEMEYLK